MLFFHSKNCLFRIDILPSTVSWTDYQWRTCGRHVEREREAKKVLCALTLIIKLDLLTNVTDKTYTVSKSNLIRRKSKTIHDGCMRVSVSVLHTSIHTFVWIWPTACCCSEWLMLCLIFRSAWLWNYVYLCFLMKIKCECFGRYRKATWWGEMEKESAPWLNFHILSLSPFFWWNRGHLTGFTLNNRAQAHL